MFHTKLSWLKVKIEGITTDPKPKQRLPFMDQKFCGYHGFLLIPSGL